MSFIDSLRDKFGLGPSWDDDEAFDEEEMNPPLGEGGNLTYSPDSPYRSGASQGSVRRRERTPDLERAQSVSGTSMRPVIPPAGGPQMRIYNVRPTAFSEASEIGDRFKQGTPVVLDLSQCADATKRRFIDFAAGLSYGLNGEITRVADSVFMLTPANVEMSEAQRRYRSRNIDSEY